MAQRAPGKAEREGISLLDILDRVCDPVSTAERPVFNRTVGLRDSWARAQKRASNQS